MTHVGLRNTVQEYETLVPALRTTNRGLQHTNLQQQTKISSLTARLAAHTDDAQRIILFFSVNPTTDWVNIHLVNPVNKVAFTQLNSRLSGGTLPHAFPWKSSVVISLLTAEATGYVFGHPVRPVTYVVKKVLGVSKKVLPQRSLPTELVPLAMGGSGSTCHDISVPTVPTTTLPARVM